jgi:hypothetical protein
MQGSMKGLPELPSRHSLEIQGNRLAHRSFGHSSNSNRTCASLRTIDCGRWQHPILEPWYRDVTTSSDEQAVTQALGVYDTGREGDGLHRSHRDLWKLAPAAWLYAHSSTTRGWLAKHYAGRILAHSFTPHLTCHDCEGTLILAGKTAC